MDNTYKRGNCRSNMPLSSKLLIYAFLLINFLVIMPPSAGISQQVAALCSSGAVPCGTVFLEDNREFICDQYRTIKDSQTSKGEVVVCQNSEYVAAPDSAPDGPGRYWVFCGNAIPSTDISFDAVVSLVKFRLSGLTREDAIGYNGAETPMDQFVSTSGEREAITRVGVKFGQTQIERIAIYAKTLNDDGTLSNGRWISSIPGENLAEPISPGIFNFDISAAGPNDVVVGIGMSFGGLTQHAINTQNMMEVHFRSINPASKALSQAKYSIIQGVQVSATKQFIYNNFQNRLLTAIGASTWRTAALGTNINPDTAGMQRTVEGMKVNYRAFMYDAAPVMDRPIQMMLTDAFQDINEDLNVQPGTAGVYFLSAIPANIQGQSNAIAGENIVQVSFSPNEHVTELANPSGIQKIYAKTPLPRSNAQRGFSAQGSSPQIQPIPIRDADTGITGKYVCFSYNNADYDIYYCPSQPSNIITTGGISLHQAAVGDSFIGSSTYGRGLQDQRYYCMKDGIWGSKGSGSETDSMDMDNIGAYHNDPEGTACTNARDLGPARQRLGYTWTGTQCCGDDADESYNDMGQNSNNALLTIRKGACWEEQGINHLGFVPTENDQSRDVLVFNGTFQGCRISASTYNSGNDNLVSLQDISGGALINNTNYCTYFEDQQARYFCSYKERWSATGAAPGMALRSIQWQMRSTDTSSSECCPVDQCWDGSSCVAHDSAPHDEAGIRYYCYHGEWRTENENIFRYSPRRDARSTNCGQGQCYLGDSQSQECVDDGFYEEDNICINGNWSTRTRMVAEALLENAGNEFSLYCDSYDKVLNYFTYNYLGRPGLPLPQGNIETEYLDANSVASECSGKTTKMTNNICVLDKGNGNIIFGVSLNCNVNAAHHNILDVFGKDASHCEEYSSTASEYKLCTKTEPQYKQGYAYYNPGINTLIFSPKYDLGISQFQGTQCSVQAPYSFLDLFSSYNYICWARIVFNTFTNTFQEDVLRAYAGRVRNINSFSKLYISKKQGKTIFGTMELGLHEPGQAAMNYLSLYYDGFSADICSMVSSLVGADLGDYNCLRSGTTFEIASASSQLNQLFQDDIWNELTAKTRIKNIEATRCYPDSCNGFIPPLCTAASLPSDPDAGSGENGCCGIGQTYLNDIDCRQDRGGSESFSNCNDNIDNDGDNAGDECDSDCGIVSTNIISKAQYEASCNDNLDNDCDGSIDSNDGDCAALTISPSGSSIVKSNTLTFSAASINGIVQQNAETYSWEIIDQSPSAAGNTVCSFTSASSSNTITLTGVNPGTCRLRVTDNRGITALTDNIQITKPEITCETITGGICPAYRPTLIAGISNVDSNGIVSLPGTSSPYKLCCGLTNGMPLSVSQQYTSNSVFLFSLTGGGRINLGPAQQGESNIYLSNIYEDVSCNAFTSPNSGNYITSNLPQAATCQSAGYDTCIATLSGENEAYVSDCDQVNDLPIKICCGVTGYGSNPAGVCQEGETRCALDMQTLERCINGRFFVNNVCQFLCLSSSCVG